VFFNMWHKKGKRDCSEDESDEDIGDDELVISEIEDEMKIVFDMLLLYQYASNHKVQVDNKELKIGIVEKDILMYFLFKFYSIKKLKTYKYSKLHSFQASLTDFYDRTYAEGEISKALKKLHKIKLIEYVPKNIRVKKGTVETTQFDKLKIKLRKGSSYLEKLKIAE
jgi:hypothetical protein